MQKILLNGCYGGFHFSKKALDEYTRRTGKQVDEFESDTLREDKTMIRIFEEFGSKFISDSCSAIYVDEYDDELYEARVEEYDGQEWIDCRPSLKPEFVDSLSKAQLVEVLRDLHVIRERTVAKKSDPQDNDAEYRCVASA